MRFAELHLELHTICTPLAATTLIDGRFTHSSNGEDNVGGFQRIIANIAAVEPI